MCYRAVYCAVQENIKWPGYLLSTQRSLAACVRPECKDSMLD